MPLKKKNFFDTDRFHQLQSQNVAGLFSIFQNELEKKKRDVKDLEKILIESTMEEIDRMSRDVLGKNLEYSEEMTKQIEKFRGILRRYKGTDSQWCQIGENNLDIIIKNAKKNSQKKGNLESSSEISRIKMLASADIYEEDFPESEGEEEEFIEDGEENEEDDE